MRRSSRASSRCEPRAATSTSSSSGTDARRSARPSGAVWPEGPDATVAVVGKGHETGQDVGGVVHPFDDRDELAAGAAPRRRGGRRVIALTLTEVAAAAAGRLHLPPDVDPDAVVVDGPVVTDSREAGPGSLYVARLGEHADGHDFVAGAVERGAVAALVAPAGRRACPCVVVDDTQDAFGALAREVVRRVPGLEVVGITGSSGKTSTKDLLGAVLATARADRRPGGLLQLRGRGAAHRLPGRPPTRASSSSRWARAASATSSYLARIAPPAGRRRPQRRHRPRRGVRVARGDRAAPSPSSSRRCPPTALAVLNADDAAVRAMAAVTARARRARRGGRTTPTCAPTDVALDAGGRADLHRRTPAGGRRAVTLGLVGRHHVGNALAVLAVALELRDAVRGRPAPHWSPRRPASRWRMEVTERDDGVTVVNDAYNANPDSMRAALTALERMGEGRRTWAVLGTMLELGDGVRGAARARSAPRSSPTTSTSCSSSGTRPPPWPTGPRGNRRGTGTAAPAEDAHPAVRDAVVPTPTPPRRCCAPSCGPVTWCCSSRAATRDYGCSVTDWPDRGRS